jgi:hypothetical protein
MSAKRKSGEPMLIHKGYKNIGRELRAKRDHAEAKMKEIPAESNHFQRSMNEDLAHKYWEGRAESYGDALVIIWDELFNVE